MKATHEGAIGSDGKTCDHLGCWCREVHPSNCSCGDCLGFREGIPGATRGRGYSREPVAPTSSERLSEALSLFAMLYNDMGLADFTAYYLPHWRPRILAFIERRPPTYNPADAPPLTASAPPASKDETHLEWRLKGDVPDKPWSLVIVHPNGFLWTVLSAAQPLEIRGVHETSREPTGEIGALMRRVNARIPSSVTPSTRIEIHPSEWITLANALAESRGPSPAETSALLSDAARDVIAERIRQVSVEGWTHQHDDEHEETDACPLLAAAISYADHAWKHEYAAVMDWPPVTWPWDRSWWKPKDKRRDLVRAAALLIAEIERLDRRALKSTAESSGKIAKEPQ